MAVACVTFHSCVLCVLYDGVSGASKFATKLTKKQNQTFSVSRLGYSSSTVNPVTSPRPVDRTTNALGVPHAMRPPPVDSTQPLCPSR